MCYTKKAPTPMTLHTPQISHELLLNCRRSLAEFTHKNVVDVTRKTDADCFGTQHRSRPMRSQPTLTRENIQNMVYWVGGNLWWTAKHVASVLWAWTPEYWSFIGSKTLVWSVGGSPFQARTWRKTYRSRNGKGKVYPTTCQEGPEGE
jgi:hypothetical protein